MSTYACRFCYRYQIGNNYSNGITRVCCVMCLSYYHAWERVRVGHPCQAIYDGIEARNAPVERRALMNSGRVWGEESSEEEFED